MARTFVGGWGECGGRAVAVKQTALEREEGRVRNEPTGSRKRREACWRGVGAGRDSKNACRGCRGVGSVCMSAGFRGPSAPNRWGDFFKSFFVCLPLRRRREAVRITANGWGAPFSCEISWRCCGSLLACFSCFICFAGCGVLFGVSCYPFGMRLFIPPLPPSSSSSSR